MEKTKDTKSYPNTAEGFEYAIDAFMENHRRNHSLFFKMIFDDIFIAGWIAAGGTDPRGKPRREQKPNLE